VEKLNISRALSLRVLPPVDLQLPPTAARSVMYVMSRDQRCFDNYGLAYAQDYALHYKLPLIVVFSFLPIVKNRAQEHFDFMLKGLQEVSSTLQSHDIPFVPLFGNPQETIVAFAQIARPALIVTDFSPLRGVRSWQKKVAQRLPLVVVDSHNCVPVWITSQKQEFGARTIRPKIHAVLNEHEIPPTKVIHHPYIFKNSLPSLQQNVAQIHKIRSSYKPNGTLIPFMPGEKAAQKLLNDFITHRLDGYSERRNDPTQDGLSNLSPYLHFGFLGSVTVLRAVREAVATRPNLRPDADTLIEELVVRKELADNFCYYNQYYDSLRGAPEWAQKTLEKHQSDVRHCSYSLEAFENAQTHDTAWNAAQKQLRQTGKMHGYMRMYWAKKILEWSQTPEDALYTAIYLNDFYSIDGGDPNGYVGILWSIAGLHDRPWGERPVYGTVRSMVYNGLKRKFDIQAYIQKHET